MHSLPHPLNDSPLASAFDVLCVELAASLGKATFSGSLQLAPQPPDYRYGRRQIQRSIPAFGIALGALLVFLQQGEYVAAGIVTSESDDDNAKPCHFTAWPIDRPGQYSPVRHRPTSAAVSRPLWLHCDLQVNGKTHIGKVTRLDRLAAAKLRELIGPVAPEPIQEVFWSAQERARFSAQLVAQENYIEGASALLETLPS